MKKKNREINIFSMSALDLFASAMGAFLLIAVMALPYYLKVNPKLIEEVKELKQKLLSSQEREKAMEKKVKIAQQQIKKLESKVKSMTRELSKTFCVIKIGWESNKKQDVDLHIVDPFRHEYYYKKRHYPGSTASLTVDSKNVKSGAEVWVNKKLSKGTYIIKYVYYSGSGMVKVRGTILTKSFTKDLPLKVMRNPNSDNKVLIAKIIVDDSGNATLQTY